MESPPIPNLQWKSIKSIQLDSFFFQLDQLIIQLEMVTDGMYR